MKRIEQAFARAKAEKRAAFMPYITAGDPDLDTTRRLVVAMAKAGADLIELGIPFSDPIADGPTIQLANERALKAGTTVTKIFECVRAIRAECDVPLILMGSYNPMYVRGIAACCKDAAEAGADGFIIPDLLPDHADELIVPAQANGLATVFLVAPTSTDERLKLVQEKSTGFVYAVSLTGVTGTRSSLPPELAAFVARVKNFITQPIGVGFGISTPEMAREVAGMAEGVIIGSAVVKRIADAAAKGMDPVPSVEEFVRSIRVALEA